MFFKKPNNFLSNFLSLKDKVREIGYFGFDDNDEVYLLHPIKQLTIFALRKIKDNSDVFGIKNKYFNKCSTNSDIILQNLSNYDVLEDIKLFDDKDNEIEFDLVICDELNGTCSMTKEKTICIEESSKYTLIPKIELNSINEYVYIKGTIYMFKYEYKRKLYT